MTCLWKYRGQVDKKWDNHQPTPVLGVARADYRRLSEETKVAQGDDLASTLYIEIICNQIHLGTIYVSEIHNSNFLMCANSFCGQKDCYYVPRWVHGQMMFTQLQRNRVKIFLPNNWFQLVLVFLQQQPNRLFHTGIWLFKYLHVIMANSVSPYESLQSSLWMACVLHPDVKCRLLKVQDLQQHTPGLTLWCVHQQESNA